MNSDRQRRPPLFPREHVVNKRYRLIREVDQGGMASVWEAEDLKLGGSVALKMAHPDLLAIPESRDHVRALWAREGRFGRQLKGRVSGIVGIYDLDETDGPESVPFIVMELLHGTPFRQRLKNRRQKGYHLSVAYVLRLADELSKILLELHDNGVVHADLKPDNLFLTRAQGNGLPALRVLDLGLMCRPEDASPVPLFKGTPAYAAPELHRREHPGFDADVFAFGVILYEALTFVRPYDDPAEPLSMEELSAKLLDKKTPAPLRVRHYRPDVPQELCDLIMSMLERELPASEHEQAAKPKKRPTMEEVAQKIHSLYKLVLDDESATADLETDAQDRVHASTHDGRAPLVVDSPKAPIEMYVGDHVPGAITAPPCAHSMEVLPAQTPPPMHSDGNAPGPPVAVSAELVAGIRDRTDPDPQPLFSAVNASVSLDVNPPIDGVRDRTDPDPHPPFVPILRDQTDPDPHPPFEEAAPVAQRPVAARTIPRTTMRMFAARPALGSARETVPEQQVASPSFAVGGPAVAVAGGDNETAKSSSSPGADKTPPRVDGALETSASDAPSPQPATPIIIVVDGVALEGEEDRKFCERLQAYLKPLRGTSRADALAGFGRKEGFAAIRLEERAEQSLLIVTTVPAPSVRAAHLSSAAVAPRADYSDARHPPRAAPRTGTTAPAQSLEPVVTPRSGGHEGARLSSRRRPLVAAALAGAVLVGMTTSYIAFRGDSSVRLIRASRQAPPALAAPPPATPARDAGPLDQ
jgi:serine/threonine protein kinase